MSVATLPAPAVPDCDGDGDLVHVHCCDPDRAWCGVDLTGAGYAPDADLSEVCRTCLLLANAGVACGVPGCQS